MGNLRHKIVHRVDHTVKPGMDEMSAEHMLRLIGLLDQICRNEVNPHAIAYFANMGGMHPTGMYVLRTVASHEHPRGAANAYARRYAVRYTDKAFREANAQHVRLREAGQRICQITDKEGGVRLEGPLWAIQELSALNG